MSRLILTILLVLIVVGVMLAAMGVLRFENTPTRAGMSIDKKELQEKTSATVEKTGEAGEKFLDKTGQVLEKTGKNLRSSSYGGYSNTSNTQEVKKPHEEPTSPPDSVGPSHKEATP